MSKTVQVAHRDVCQIDISFRSIHSLLTVYMSCIIASCIYFASVVVLVFACVLGWCLRRIGLFLSTCIFFVSFSFSDFFLFQLPSKSNILLGVCMAISSLSHLLEDIFYYI